MELVDYLRLLWRRRAFVVLGLVVGLMGGYEVAHRATTTYSASVRLFVASSTAGDGTNLISTLGQVANSEPVVVQVLGQSPGQGGISVATSSSGGSSSVLLILVTGVDPQRVTAATAAYASVLPGAYAAINKLVPVSFTLLDRSGAVATPLHKSRTIVIGGLLGLLVGLAGALLRETLDTTMRTPEELGRRIGHEVLAAVPDDRSRGVVTILEPQSVRSEAYRRIRAALRLRAPERYIRTLLVTSSTNGEGKTTTVLNVAAAAAQAGERVVVVDADLRRPSIALATATRSSQGLTEVLLGTLPLAGALQPWGPLTVLTSGEETANPVELLGSRAMRDLLTTLGESYDLVIVDSPAMLPIADAEVLAADCDAVLFVSRLGSTSGPRTQRAIGALERLGRDIVGVVANFAPATETEAVPTKRRRGETPVPTPLALGEGGSQLPTMAPESRAGGAGGEGARSGADQAPPRAPSVPPPTPRALERLKRQASAAARAGAGAENPPVADEEKR